MTTANKQEWLKTRLNIWYYENKYYRAHIEGSANSWIATIARQGSFLDLETKHFDSLEQAKIWAANKVEGTSV